MPSIDTSMVPLMKSGDHSHFFKTTDQKNIHYMERGSGNSIVMVFPGMAEPAFKYWEVATELVERGHHVFVIDHFGHGLSDHPLGKTEKNKIHIDDFGTYVRHACEWYDHIFASNQQAKIQFLAHSMGGLIACHVVMERPIDNIALSSPMFAINTKGMPRPLAMNLAKILPERSFAPLQKEYNQIDIRKNAVTNSKKRAVRFQNLLGNFPDFKRKGVTNAWVRESLITTKKFLERTEWLHQCNMIMFQAGKDTFVQPKVNTLFAQNRPRCKYHFIPEAKHEILMETDSIRQPVMEKIFKFLEPNRKDDSSES